MNQETHSASSGQARQCQNCKNQFTIEPEDFDFYEKVKVSPPTFCWLCRMQRRMAFYPEKAFYKRPDLFGKMVFSRFSPQAPVKVYDHDYWWSDNWNPLEFGRDYDFSRPFFDQFRDLLSTIPLSSRSILDLVRSDYCDQATSLKDCYLVFNSSYIENTLYSSRMINVKDSVDIDKVIQAELCYDCFEVGGVSRVFFSSFIEDSTNIFFSRDCVGCTSCFGCANLRNKSYYIFNKPYSKEAYQDEIKKFDLGSWKNREEIKKIVSELHLKLPVRYMHGRQNVNVLGESIYNSKNVFYSDSVTNLEDCRYCSNVSQAKDCWDYLVWGINAENLYECVECGDHVAQLKFCFDCWPSSHDLQYCIQCHSSSNLFGCIGLRKKQYCIFNKQYTKGEYETLVARIIKHMNDMPFVDKCGRVYRYGEFFPIELSPFGYNESLAAEYFKLSENEAMDKGYRWYRSEEKKFTPTISGMDLPDHIRDVKDEVLQETIGCVHQGQCDQKCTTAFRITSQELQFYRRMNLALPRLCPNCRYYERAKLRNPLQLWDRVCARCHKPIRTVYSPNRKEIVYCEQCYNAEVV